MKNDHTAHFELVKLQNRRIIRNLLRLESPQGIAQLAEKAALSYPTVAALMKELLERGEVLLTSETESCGGRPGTRYELNADYQHALILYFQDWTLQAVLYNTYGDIVERDYIEADAKITIGKVVQFAKRIKARSGSLTAIALGIPGVVHGTEILYLPKFSGLEGKELYQRLKDELYAEVFIENDINAMTLAEIGTQCSLANFDARSDFAHIAYVNDCIGVGIAQAGEVIKGSHGYAGELEYLCEDVRKPVETLATSITALVCVLDLPEILISGDMCAEQTVQDIKMLIQKRLPKERIPLITVVQNTSHNYEYGLWKRILLRWAEEN